MVQSKTRGYDIYYDGKDWRYQDNNHTIEENRPCAYCGKYPTKEGFDACLGRLQGVAFACCGHGDKTKAMIIRK